MVRILRYWICLKSSIVRSWKKTSTWELYVCGSDETKDKGHLMENTVREWWRIRKGNDVAWCNRKIFREDVAFHPESCDSFLSQCFFIDVAILSEPFDFSNSQERVFKKIQGESKNLQVKK